MARGTADNEARDAAWEAPPLAAEQRKLQVPAHPPNKGKGSGFLTDACRHLGRAEGQPAVAWLWSYPGSGNTMTRLLVEAASGLSLIHI